MTQKLRFALGGAAPTLALLIWGCSAARPAAPLSTELVIEQPSQISEQKAESSAIFGNRPPVIDAVPSAHPVFAGEVARLRLTATDPEGRDIAWSLGSTPKGAELVRQEAGNVELRYSVPHGASGPIKLEVNANDGQNTTTTPVRLFASERGASAGTIVDVRSAARNVLVVVVETDAADQLPEISAPAWSLAGFTPVQLGRHTYVWHEESEAKHYAMKLRHHFYLEMPSPIPFGQNNKIETPFGSLKFSLNDKDTVCESLHVNQVGYSAGSRQRYANFGIFLGDLGPRQLEAPLQFEVLQQDTQVQISRGQASYWGDDSKGTSGSYVYRLDLATLPSGGPYVIYLPGVGKSHAFHVGPVASAHAAYVTARALYHQRCGAALDSKFTPYFRAACTHTDVQVTDAEPPEFIHETSNEKRSVRGGYHDAADFDRRLVHTLIPAWMLNTYEAFPDRFTDQQLNIPESGNGIPDWLDEALWGLRVWEELQESDGGVRAGTETSAHPTYGTIYSANDTAPYKTYRKDGHTTATAAGVFAQASRLISPFEQARAKELLSAALSAWNWVAENQPPSAHAAQRMYASLELYLATGDDKFHQEFLKNARYLLNQAPWPEQYKPWFNLNTAWEGMVFAPYFFGYLITERPTDTQVREGLGRILLAAASEVEETLNKSAYPIGQAGPYGWGTATNQGRYAEPLLLAYRLTKEQRYLDAASQLADYTLGLNPAGKSYVTRLGANSPHNPLHTDSYFTALRGIGAVPGITVYGPVDDPSVVEYEARVYEKVYPKYRTLPRERRYTEGWSFVGQQEFTTWETVALNACMYSVLAPAAR